MCGEFRCGPRPAATRIGSDAGKPPGCPCSTFTRSPRASSQRSTTAATPRDLFDAGLIPDIPGLDPAKLRTAFVVYGGGARADWRAVCRESPTIQSAALARQLRSALTTTDAQRTRPIGADAFLAELQAKAAPAQRMVVPLNPTEVEFLDRLLDHGDIAPELLTADPALQQRIASELWLTWKAINVRDHNARAAHQRGVPQQPTTAPAYPSLTVQPGRRRMGLDADGAPARR